MDITDKEYDEIQKESEARDIWVDFRQWLIDDQGVAKATARTYATQSRRILRELDGDITSESLFNWVNCRPATHRTPFRSSWRRYRLFMEKKHKTTLATFPQGESIPAEIIAALALIKNRGIGSGSIGKLTIKQDDSARRDALAKINRDVEHGELLVILDPDNSLYLIPADAYKTLIEWGKQGSRMDDSENPRWLVPALPGGSDAMKAIKITRLIRNAKAE